MTGERVIDIPWGTGSIPRVPEMSREVRGGGLRLMLLPPGGIEATFVLKAPIIDVNINPVSADWSWQSDVVISGMHTADSLAFVPANGQWRLRATNFLPGLTLEIDHSRWSDPLRESYDLDIETLGYTHYEHDPVAADLGRAGINLLAEEHRSGEDADMLAVEAIAMGLVTRLARRLDEDRSIATDRPVASVLAKTKLRSVTDYIETHLSEGMTVSELAGVAGYSTAYFAEAFKLATGVPPARYVVIRRIARAKGLLAFSDEPLVQVALSCGFSGQAHFTRVFKQMTGTTPRQFRLMRSN